MNRLVENVNPTKQSLLVTNDYSNTVIFYISITLKIFWKHFEISFSLKVLKGHFLLLFQILRKHFDRISSCTCSAFLAHLSNNPDLSHPVFIWLCRIFVHHETFYIHFDFFLLWLKFVHGIKCYFSDFQSMFLWSKFWQ